MSAIGPSGSNAHALNFSQAGLRRGAGFPPTHPGQQNKQQPGPHGASPYQTQAYPPQQQHQGAYPQHMFTGPNPVNGNVPNGPSRTPNPHVPNALGVQRQQRNAPPRQQMPPQHNPPHMLFPQSMSQSVQHDPILSQQHPQHAQHHQQQQQHQSHPGHPGHQGHQSHQQHPHATHQQHQSHPANQPHPGHPQHSQHPGHHQGHSGHQGRQSMQPQQQPPTPQQQQQQLQQQQQPTQTPVPLPQQPMSSSTNQPQNQQQQQQQQQQMQQAQQMRSTPQQQSQQLPQQQQEDSVTEDVDMDTTHDINEDSSLLAKLANDNFIPTSPMGKMMSPPPEGGSYPTLEAVQKAVLRYCTSVGYAIVIGRSKKTVPGLKKVLFVCDRAGKPPSRVSPEFRKRKTSSRKCDCPFGFFAIEQRTQWTIRYRPNSAHLEHNHGPSEGPSDHPAARKLDSKMVAAVKRLKDNGAGVPETLQILQTENPDCHLLPRDIYNARAAINRNPPKANTPTNTTVPEERTPTIYNKTQQSPEDRIRSDLRRELAKAREDMKKMEDEKQKEIDSLKAKLDEKDVLIKKFEMFIDICNERVMIQRERLSDGSQAGGGNRRN